MISGYSYIGGLIGNFDGGTLTLKNSINTGSVTALSSNCFAGGLLAIIDYRTTSGIYANITNCINYGAITSELAGGLIGNLKNPSIVSIKNSANCGILNGSYANGFTGTTDTSVTIINSYTLFNYSDSSTQCTLEQVNDPFFYKDTLSFRESAWDVSQLDTEKGKYPTLKICP